MHVNLNTGLRKLLFALACLLASGLYIAGISGHYLAYHWGVSLDPGLLQRAARLEPGNAETRWELGRYKLFISQSPMEAISDLEAAVVLNPHVARYWLDLAAGNQVLGHLQQQSWALERALWAEPTAPDVAWEAASFYLVQNDLAHALPLFRLVMANDPNQTSVALKSCWHATQSVDVMLSEAVPAEPAPLFAFLNLLTAEGETIASEVAWQRLINLGKQFPLSDAFPYFDYLLQRHETAKAVRVWDELVKRNPNIESYRQPGNLVVDGSLERSLLNGGFDWRYSITDAVQLSIDSTEFHAGNQALRMVFKGPAVSDAGVFEYIPVRPNTDYHFSIFTKAEDIESASGPRVALLDAYSGRPYVLTDDSLGTTGWRPQSADFRTGEDTSLLVVTVRRVPGGPLIKGKFWIDDVSLAQR